MFIARITRRVSLTLFASFLLVLSTLAQVLPTPPAAGMSAITPTELRMHLSFLASDELGGRYTLSSGNKIAARYLASRLESYGYRGAAAGGSFLQEVKLDVTGLDPERISFTLDNDKLKYGDDFLYFSNAEASKISGELVFVGYGISAPELKEDDYAGIDVKGKIVVVATGTPAALKNERIAGTERGEAAARAHGASSVIQLLNSGTLARYSQFRLSQNGERVSLPTKQENGDIATTLPTIVASQTLGARLLEGSGTSFSDFLGLLDKGDPLTVKLKPHTATINGGIEHSVGEAQNVVGILEGSDPQLKQEYVTFSAHYDHLKTSANGVIYPGADDDGSGTSSVLNIAKAMALTRPKRSILIIFHTGEELGLFGSQYFTDYQPLVPLKQIVADFNIDMIGRVKPPNDTKAADKYLSDYDSVFLIGADRLSTELNKLSEATNRDTEKLNLDYKYNAPNDSEQLYERSDHYNYAKHGIPVIFYFTGLHEDYHRPSDRVEKINFDKMARVARLVFATGWRVANLDHRIEVDAKPESSK